MHKTIDVLIRIHTKQEETELTNKENKSACYITTEAQETRKNVIHQRDKSKIIATKNTCILQSITRGLIKRPILETWKQMLKSQHTNYNEDVNGCNKEGHHILSLLIILLHNVMGNPQSHQMISLVALSLQEIICTCYMCDLL